MDTGNQLNSDNSTPAEQQAEARVDVVGTSIVEGMALVTHLWQSPHDAATRARIRQLLAIIKFEVSESEGGPLRRACQDMLVALRATQSYVQQQFANFDDDN